MRSKMIRLVCVIACLAAIAIPAFAQYGYPLKGTWSGDWWFVKGKETHVLLDFNYVGNYTTSTLTGTLNPGPDQVPMQKLTLTPPDVIGAGKAAIAARDAALANPAPAPAAPAAAPAAGAAPPAKAAPSGSVTPLMMGSSGPGVAALQKKLGDLGFAPGETSGTFGKGTQAAVMAFQKSKKLTADGIVGASTAALLSIDGSSQASVASSTATTTPRGTAPARGRGGAPAIKDNMTIASDPWLLHFEADGKDAAGKPVHYIVDGKMENLGSSYSRVITGTWKVGNKVGNFKVTRN